MEKQKNAHFLKNIFLVIMIFCLCGMCGNITDVMAENVDISNMDIPVENTKENDFSEENQTETSEEDVQAFEEFAEDIQEEAEQESLEESDIPFIENEIEKNTIEDKLGEEIFKDELEENEHPEDLSSEETLSEELKEFTDQTENIEEITGTADMDIRLTADTENPKGGELVIYECEIQNTGDILSRDVILRAQFSCPKVTYEWQAISDGEIQENNLRIFQLQPGERRKVYLTATLTEAQEGKLECKIEAETSIGEKKIKKETSLDLYVTPLKINFEVKKTSNKNIVKAGDVVTYQICIRNTGERTLHSIITTEKFANAQVKAYFLEQEGVVLSADKTKAHISELKAGDAIALLAEVIIPKDMKAGDLLNEVLVTTEETGTEIKKSQSVVKMEQEEIPKDVEITEVPKEDTAEVKTEAVYKENPQTADATLVDFWMSIVFCTGITIYFIFIDIRRRQRKH